MGLDRREFTVSLPAWLTLVAGAAGQATQTEKPKLQTLTSGVFPPKPSSGSNPGRASHAYLKGMLKAGDIQLEMHETIQQPGAVHEAVGHHLHNEIWCVQQGEATLFINGTEHRMQAGDVGLVCAGDQHWIGNAGDTELAYFVITVGPPE